MRSATAEKGKTNMTRTSPKLIPKSVTESSGNVFADLGLPNPKQELTKAELTLQLYRIIKQRGMTQAEAGRALGIKQPHVSVRMWKSRSDRRARSTARCPSHCGEGNEWRQRFFRDGGLNSDHIGAEQPSGLASFRYRRLSSTMRARGNWCVALSCSRVLWGAK